MNKNNKIQIKEATGDGGGGGGSYIAPMQLGIRKFKKSEMNPFTIAVSKYDSPELEYDSYDGSMDETKKQIKKLESKARKITNYITKHPNSTSSDEDGNNINQTPGKKGLNIVPIVTEWVEITKDTILEDIVSNEPKSTSNYERVINKFKKDIPSFYHKEYDLIAQKIKDFVQERGYVVKIINACNTGFRGVRTNKAIILCSPETFPNFATFVYLLFHELRHEQQMSEFDLKDTYMGDVEDFEEFFKIYWQMELDADKYGKDWVKKIGDVLKLPHIVYNLDPMIENYPSMSNMVKQFTLHLHREIQTLKSRGMEYSDISDLDIVKKHLKTLEDMF
jgi:hypothetical protein